MHSYNNSYHRSIKTTPSKVNKKNEQQIFENLYGYKQNEGDPTFVSIKFKKGTHVRIVKEKTIFEKGYTSGLSKDIFIIDKIIAQNPVLYTLKELTGKSKPGMYYTEELHFQVEQVELSNDSD